MRPILALLFGMAALAAPLTASSAAQEELVGRIFRVPLTLEARILADEAQLHIGNKRWSEAIETLATMLAQREGDVLPKKHAPSGSQFPLYPGAAQWALDQLHDLPPEALELYRGRYDDVARHAFEDARRNGERVALVDVVRRWPLTDGAVLSWWALGDLELELGHVDQALLAWERGAEALEHMGRAPSPGARSRLAFAEEVRSQELEPPPDNRSGFELSGPGEGRGPVPLKEADPWEFMQMDLKPFNRRGTHCMYPVLAGDRVLVSSGYRIFAVDAYSPELIWEAGPPAGWNDLETKKREQLFADIDYESSIIAPAVGGGVVVAALQIPYATHDRQDFQGIRILKALAQRRLFAFDLETGAELWNHAPPLAWDGEFGTYGQRMLIASAPIVVGTRVVVPCYRMDSRIEFQIACYDLTTGSRQWSTSLVSGQVELNMFGRQMGEYVGAPLAVDGDRLFAVTHLGTVASLDLFTGRIRWQATYDQLPLFENRTWNPRPRPVFWRNAPAAVAGGVVVATPMDSADILGLDAEDGRVLWSHGYDQLPAVRGRNGRNEGATDYDVLLGADEDRIYLGSQPVSALMMPGGLKSRRGSFKSLWSVWPGPDERVARGRLPRPVIGAEEVLIPQLSRRIVVDRATGVRQERKSVGWSERERGNVLIGEGMLFVLTTRRLHAFFDWEILLARAQAAREANPDDVQVVTDHAELLLRRARVEADDAGAALDLLAQARELLEPRILAAGGVQDPRVAQTLHHVLRAVADAKLRRLDTLGAIAALQEALPLAARMIDMRDTLLEQEELYRLRHPDRWRGVLAQLESHCAVLPYPHSPTRDPLQWLVGESILDLEAAELRDVAIPVGLWVLFTRAEASARSLDSGAALGDLHTALERYGDRALTRSLTVGELARDRIARRLELDPDAARNYAPFEQRAEELFARALEVRDPILLKEVGRLYPHSRAAAEGARVNLDWAYEAGNAATTAELAYASLGDGPAPTEEDVQTLLKVGVVLGRSGNTAFEQGLLTWLAERHGSVRSLLPESDGRTLAELAEEIGSAGPTPTIPPPHFDESLKRARQVTGVYEWLGTVPLARVVAETGPKVTAILGRGTRLMAFSADDPTSELWSYELTFPISSERLVLTPTRVIVGGADRVIALDAATGEMAWKHSLEDAAVAYLAAEGGVLLVPTRGAGSDGKVDRLRAFDLVGGLPLWSLRLDGANWLRPVCGEGRAAIIQAVWRGSTPALIVDVYRGRVVRTLDLGEGVDDKADDSAWIEDGRLILPVFSSSRYGPSRITAYDLDSGRVAWSEEIEQGLELFAVVTAE
ncbi:MAG: PQQ-binding-like beta-propeller repeat protein, partial [Planctomycetota bacterium]|nr:PQQ-binding-like beta-propeller repeat protein [Planctomycetota bacterium]